MVTMPKGHAYLRSWQPRNVLFVEYAIHPLLGLCRVSPHFGNIGKPTVLPKALATTL